MLTFFCCIILTSHDCRRYPLGDISLFKTSKRHRELNKLKYTIPLFPVTTDSFTSSSILRSHSKKWRECDVFNGQSYRRFQRLGAVCRGGAKTTGEHLSRDQKNFRPLNHEWRERRSLEFVLLTREWTGTLLADIMMVLGQNKHLKHFNISPVQAFLR